MVRITTVKPLVCRHNHPFDDTCPLCRTEASVDPYLRNQPYVRRVNIELSPEAVQTLAGIRTWQRESANTEVRLTGPLPE